MTRAVSWGALLNYFVARVIPALFMVAATPVLVGLIGITEYGLYTTVTAIVLMAESLGVGWLRQSALRGTGDAKQAIKLLPRWPVLLAIGGPATAVAMTLYYLRGQLHIGDDTALLTAATALCGATGIYVLVVTQAQRDMRAGRVALGEGVRASVGLLAGVAAHATVLQGASAALAGMTIGNVAAILVMWRSWLALRTVSHRHSNAVLKSYWAFGWPMSLWLAASSGLFYIDRLVLSIWLGPETAGRYGAVADVLLRGFAFIAAPVLMAMHPAIMSAWNQGKLDLAIHTLAAHQKILGFVLTVAITGVLTLGPMLIPVAAGVAAPSWTVLIFLVSGSAIWQLGQLAQKRLELSGRSLTVLLLMGVCLLLTVAVDVAAIPAMGPLGAAVGLAVGATAYWAGCVHLGRRAVAEHTRLAVETKELAHNGTFEQVKERL